MCEKLRRRICSSSVLPVAMARRSGKSGKSGWAKFNEERKARAKRDQPEQAAPTANVATRTTANPEGIASSATNPPLAVCDDVGPPAPQRRPKRKHTQAKAAAAPVIARQEAARAREDPLVASSSHVDRGAMHAISCVGAVGSVADGVGEVALVHASSTPQPEGQRGSIPSCSPHAAGPPRFRDVGVQATAIAEDRCVGEAPTGEPFFWRTIFDMP